MLVNPAGVVFGPGSQLNVGGITASTLAISDADFLDGDDYHFRGNATASKVLNRGKLNANGGIVALIAPVVENEGVIDAPRGAAVLAGRRVGHPGLHGRRAAFRHRGKSTLDALAENKGLIRADEGRVILAANAAHDLLSGAVNNTGVIEAREITRKGGRILLTGAAVTNKDRLFSERIELAGDLIINDGEISANGEGIEGGGAIGMEASRAIINTGRVSATGKTGGRIRVATRNGIDAGEWDASGEDAGGDIHIRASGNWEQTAAGRMDASAAAGDGGTIRVTAEKGLWLSGTLDASGGAPENARGNARGGDISLTADTLTLAGAHLHADGATDGGRIRAGGGWQGKDTDLPNARKTRVTASTELTANAGTSGDGGTVVIWSEETTTFAGAIAATGGRSGGDGGRAEVSSHDKLGFTGDADLSAHAGARRKLLLDPKNIVIDDSTPSAYEVIPLTYARPQGR
uniref:Filamentous hemagglutinin family N-terminal domain-containing protein n=2 Tax=Candidatus Kentrum sp. SD TaxID=2126332 RepID=A0A451BP21_9GAMM|nr:MAG: filamentous hemagglutinin family N-terminal domain-containing protein [Candidatus Kentron sp. SD]